MPDNPEERNKYAEALMGYAPYVAMFLGPGARGLSPAMRKAYGKAAQMEKQGADPRQIWADTGRYKDMGKWWHEVDDTGAKFSMPTAESKLPDVLSHPDIYKAYPTLKDTKAVINPNERQTSTFAAFVPKDNTVKFFPVGANRGNALHEAQHVIQGKEGIDFVDVLKNWDQRGIERMPHITQLRAEMTPQQRMVTYPLDTPGWVPLEKSFNYRSDYGDPTLTKWDYQKAALKKAAPGIAKAAVGTSGAAAAGTAAYDNRDYIADAWNRIVGP